MEEIRDYVLIAGFISLTVLTLFVLVTVSAIGYLALRLLGALNGFAEGRVATGFAGANARLGGTSESGPPSLLDLALFGFSALQRLRAARKPKPKKRDRFGFPFFSR